MRRTTEPQEMLKANIRKQIVGKTMHALASTLTSRAKLGAALGTQYAGERDVYVAAGYPKDITYTMYEGRYQRQDVAKRIVNAFPAATWRGKPEIYETEDSNETAFEKSWNELLAAVNVWYYMLRVDKMAGVYQYATLLMGFDDASSTAELKDEVKKGTGRRLLFLRPFFQDKSVVKTWVTEPNNPRFGLPETYELDMSADTASLGEAATSFAASGVASKNIVVHWSRIIHVADGCLDNDVYGVPRLEAVYNRLLDFDKVISGPAEGYWRDGFPGLSMELDAEADYSQSLAAMEDEIENYIHNLTRVMKLQGVKATALTGKTTDPKGMVEVLFMLLSAATGIPARILTGSERGELASSQDAENWNGRVDERRRDFAEPVMVKEFIDRLIKYGVLPKPKEYIVNWPEAYMLSAKDQADVGTKKAQAISFYLTHPGAEFILPPYYFLTKILMMTEEEAQSIAKEVEESLAEEEADVAADEEERAAEEKRLADEEAALAEEAKPTPNKGKGKKKS